MKKTLRKRLEEGDSNVCLRKRTKEEDSKKKTRGRRLQIKEWRKKTVRKRHCSFCLSLLPLVFFSQSSSSIFFFVVFFLWSSPESFLPRFFFLESSSSVLFSLQFSSSNIILSEFLKEKEWRKTTVRKRTEEEKDWRKKTIRKRLKE